VTQAIDDRIRLAAARTHLSPSLAQREAGNYRKGTFWWNGREIAIENPRGSTRSGMNKAGQKRSVKMAGHYGYIRRTKSKADGDAVDVFIGPHPESDLVCIVDQHRANGGFDEHKCIIGCTSVVEAKALYLACYSAGWTGLKSITPMTRQQFFAWLDKGNTAKPIEKQVSRYSAGDQDRVPAGSPEGGEFVAEANVRAFDSEQGDNYREKALAWAERELADKSFTNTATGKEIKISMGGIKKTLSHLPDHGPALALTVLPHLLKTASFDSTHVPPVSDGNIKAWHVLQADLNIDGLPHTTFLKIREDGNGHYYYDQHVTKRKDPPYKRGASGKPDVTPAGGSKDSIGPVDPFGKQKSDSDDYSRFEIAAARVRYARDHGEPWVLPYARNSLFDEDDVKRDEGGRFAEKETRKSTEKQKTELKPDLAVVNVPLSKRGDIDKQIDQFKEAQSKAMQAKMRNGRKVEKDDREEARKLFDEHGESLAQSTFQKNGTPVKDSLAFIKSKISVNPAWARKLLEGWVEQKSKQSSNPANRSFVPHPIARHGDFVTVHADPAKLDREWSKDTEGYLPKEGKGKSEIEGRRKGFEKFLESGKPIEQPHVAIADATGNLTFGDGRHRTRVLMNQGEKSILLTVHKDDADKVKKLVGIGNESAKPSERTELAAAKARQIGLFSQAELGGATQLFDTGKEFVKEKKGSPSPVKDIAPSKLEKIEDELKARAEEKKPLEGQRDLTHSDFSKFRDEYLSHFKNANKYKPNEIGSRHFTDKMAQMADDHPDWVEKIEAEEQPAKVSEEPKKIGTTPFTHATGISKVSGGKGRFDGCKTIGEMKEKLHKNEWLTLKKYGAGWQAEVHSNWGGNDRFIAAAQPDGHDAEPDRHRRTELAAARVTRYDRAIPVPKQREAHKPAATPPTSKRGGWITLGGARVQLDENGKIMDGCPGVKGEYVSSLKNESDESRRVREVRQDHAEARGLTGRDVSHADVKKLGNAQNQREHAAAKEVSRGTGHSTASVLRALPAAHELHAADQQLFRPALNHLQKLTGATPAKMRDWENSYKDHSSWPGWDDATRNFIIPERPELGIDQNDHDAPAKLWQMLRDAGRQTKAVESHSPKVARTAVEMLGSPARQKRGGDADSANRDKTFNHDEFDRFSRYSRVELAAARVAIQRNQFLQYASKIK